LELLNLGDVYVIFNGGTGTISEFAMAWGLARLFFGHHKPLILYGEWWKEIMGTFVKNMRIREVELKVYKIVTSPQEVLQEIKKLER
jgi:predicted Rossmann-fold nucleotide-binding protein